MDFLFFWKPIPVEPIGPSCLGQWYPSPFAVDGETYETAEHFMMVGKSRLFGDEDVARQILADPDPRSAKKLGRKVKSFDDEVWRTHRTQIVFDGNVAKFSQHDGLREYLLGTGDAVLAEASPLDTIWGIGYGEKNDAARDPSRWRGVNLLGFVLMDVRESFRA